MRDAYTLEHPASRTASKGEPYITVMFMQGDPALEKCSLTGLTYKRSTSFLLDGL
jgi:hypothetical protein